MTNILIATILSFLIPGLGQIYEGQNFLKGIVFLIIGIILYILIYTVETNICIISFIYSIYSAYDACRFLK
ncbi:hypothetical protein ALNOE001_20460 [Candidatus Methanobinarius endosymbioticus]|uniref:TM2 domain-containing protein n=1 Tax=Candidatus Methanobinarius endosymbioticus TaxID=2006182 RepID=A0A366M9B2_9EURY|nr:hypothetical protein ALNOE001_20460 [Candidatus Methanobinarius endosymbioticus]